MLAVIGRIHGTRSCRLKVEGLDGVIATGFGIHLQAQISGQHHGSNSMLPHPVDTRHDCPPDGHHVQAMAGAFRRLKTTIPLVFFERPSSSSCSPLPKLRLHYFLACTRETQTCLLVATDPHVRLATDSITAPTGKSNSCRPLSQA